MVESMALFPHLVQNLGSWAYSSHTPSQEEIWRFTFEELPKRKDLRRLAFGSLRENDQVATNHPLIRNTSLQALSQHPELPCSLLVPPS